MCGRFAQFTPTGELINLFELTESQHLQPRDNIAPAQDNAVTRAAGQHRQLALLRWGLLRRWAKVSRSATRLSTPDAKPFMKAVLQSGI